MPARGGGGDDDVLLHVVLEEVDEELGIALDCAIDGHLPMDHQR